MKDPPHRTIHPTFSYLTTTQPSDENKKTSTKPCTPPPLLPSQRHKTTSAFQPSSKTDPRPKCTSMASSRRVHKNIGRQHLPLQRPTKSPLPHRTIGGPSLRIRATLGRDDDGQNPIPWPQHGLLFPSTLQITSPTPRIVCLRSLSHM